MPIIVHYGAGVRPDVIKGTSWKQLDESTRAIGVIHLTSLEDGHRIIVNRASWVKVDEVSDEVWEARVQAEKDAQEDSAARVKDSADRQRAQMAADAQAALEAKRLGNRIKRLFGKRP